MLFIVHVSQGDKLFVSLVVRALIHLKRLSEVKEVMNWMGGVSDESLTMDLALQGHWEALKGWQRAASRFFWAVSTILCKDLLL